MWPERGRAKWAKWLKVRKYPKIYYGRQLISSRLQNTDVTHWGEFLKEGKREGERLRETEKESLTDAICHRKTKNNEIRYLEKFRGETERDIY